MLGKKLFLRKEIRKKYFAVVHHPTNQNVYLIPRIGVQSRLNKIAKERGKEAWSPAVLLGYWYENEEPEEGQYVVVDRSFMEKDEKEKFSHAWRFSKGERKQGYMICYGSLLLSHYVIEVSGGGKLKYPMNNVHHKGGTFDNRRNNLEILTRNKHAKIHALETAEMKQERRQDVWLDDLRTVLQVLA